MIITTREDPLSKIKPYLPTGIQAVFSKLDSRTRDKITEIRLHSGGASTVTLDGTNCCITSSGLSKNMTDSVKVSPEELESFIFKLCRGSVYSYEPTLREGYITRDGIRVGLSGKINVKGGVPEGFGKVRGVNIRLPHHIPGAASDVLTYLAEKGFPGGKGFLIISEPGIGKTTLLRDLAISLSKGFCLEGKNTSLRVCVIDERSEIYIDGCFDDCSTDFLSDCPKAKGMEIATRVLSPQVIICDEIGSEKEADEILKCTNSGVIFIASAHAKSYSQLCEKKHIMRLIEAGVFGATVCLSRRNDTIHCELTIIAHDEKGDA